MISIEGEKHKGTVITITNYSDYAQNLVNVPAHKYTHNNAHDEASIYAPSYDISAHNNAHESAHHEQYIFNNKLLNDRPRKIFCAS